MCNRNIKPYFDRNYIIVEDLEHFLSARKAAQAFTLLDVDGDGKVRCRLQIIDCGRLGYAMQCAKTQCHRLHRVAPSVWITEFFRLAGKLELHDRQLLLRYAGVAGWSQRQMNGPSPLPPQVSLHDIRDAVINIYRERKFLAATLRDTRTVVGRLELIIGVVVHLVFLFFYLLIFRVRPNDA